MDEDGQPYWRTIEELHSEWKPHPFEGKDADTSREYKKCDISFLSHRWSLPTQGLPDDDEHTKAMVDVWFRLLDYARRLHPWRRLRQVIT